MSPSIAPLWVSGSSCGLVAFVVIVLLVRRIARCCRMAELAPAIIAGYDRTDAGHHQAGRRRAAARRPDYSAHRGRGIPDSCHAARAACRSAQAEGFYAVHRERPFFGSLTAFMSSGPAIVLVLEAPDAIRKWRTLMGATDPAKADAGTLRKEFAQSIERNATHGSDAPETAAYEIGYFFAGVELV